MDPVGYTTSLVVFRAKCLICIIQGTIQHSLTIVCFSPQVELVPGLYPPVKTQWFASSLPLSPFLPCLKCAASPDSRCPAAWMSLFAVVKVTDSGAGMSPSAQVGLSSAEKCSFSHSCSCCFKTGTSHHR